MIIQSLTLAGKSILAKFPATYDPTKAYPAECFLPGLGETATAGTSKLLLHGPYGPGGLTDTIDDGLDVIAFAIEPDEAYGASVAELTGLLKAISTAYKISKFYLSGLSLGCQEWMNLVWNPGQDLSMIGGVFMLSADPPNVAPYGPAVVDYTLFKKNNMLYYGGCGTADSMYGMQQPVYAGIKAAGGNAFWDSWQNAGHGDPVWANFWNLTWLSPAMGMTHRAKIAQLSPVVASTPVPAPSPAPVPAKTITKVTVTAVTTYSDGSTASNTQTLQ